MSFRLQISNNLSHEIFEGAASNNSLDLIKQGENEPWKCQVLDLACFIDINLLIVNASFKIVLDQSRFRLKSHWVETVPSNIPPPFKHNPGFKLLYLVCSKESLTHYVKLVKTRVDTKRKAVRVYRIENVITKFCLICFVLSFSVSLCSLIYLDIIICQHSKNCNRA